MVSLPNWQNKFKNIIIIDKPHKTHHSLPYLLEMYISKITFVIHKK
jgi:hypothetical protein